MTDKIGNRKCSKGGHGQIHDFTQRLLHGYPVQAAIQGIPKKGEGRERGHRRPGVDEGRGESLGSFLGVVEVICDRAHQ